MSKPKKTSDDRWNKLKNDWENAPRGQDGLKRQRSQDFQHARIIHIGEILTEPVVLTADGVEKCILMPIESYFALLAVNPNPPRQPMMLRHEGRLFREVI